MKMVHPDDLRGQYHSFLPQKGYAGELIKAAIEDARKQGANLTYLQGQTNPLLC